MSVYRLGQDMKKCSGMCFYHLPVRFDKANFGTSVRFTKKISLIYVGEEQDFDTYIWKKRKRSCQIDK